MRFLRWVTFISKISSISSTCACAIKSNCLVILSDVNLIGNLLIWEILFHHKCLVSLSVNVAVAGKSTFLCQNCKKNIFYIFCCFSRSPGGTERSTMRTVLSILVRVSDWSVIGQWLINIISREEVILYGQGDYLIHSFIHGFRLLFYEGFFYLRKYYLSIRNIIGPCFHFVGWSNHCNIHHDSDGDDVAYSDDDDDNLAHWRIHSFLISAILA